jgi:hypothetical protein
MQSAHAISKIYLRPISVLYPHLHVDLVSYLFLSYSAPFPKSLHTFLITHIPIYLVLSYLIT